ncbi:hypothetical protein [Methylovirgula sp. HY1]|uniref:hypothetical protein n=1 Tax=Methylovirgula sp. HY1 TaxID=2822761 RepID=UPI001C5B5584|nr:hypothetical protein [Methylovirgula sp. HY1]QXX74674.1 hypothetical protein MHY1_01490 [Methylovirgula sp. HY1]
MEAMVVWQLTLMEFMAGQGQGEGYAKQNPADDLIAALTPPGWIAGTEVPLEEDPEFATAIANRPDGFAGNQVLLGKEGDGYKPIGAYIDAMVAIKDEFRGREIKLSTDLILRCAEHRPVPTERELTIPGHKALMRAHFAAVERAMIAGLAVPQNVLDDYGF